VLTQRDVELELIVVDDGSTDHTSSRIGKLGDPRVRVVRHESSEGVARARNDGIGAARAPWVAFLDDDDAWAPTKLRRQLDALAAGGRFSYTGVVRIGEDLHVVGIQQAPAADTIRRVLQRQNIIDAPSSVVVSTSLLRELDGFDEQFSILADWELYLRLASAADPAVVAEPLIAYRLHDDNMHATRAAELLAELRQLAGKHPGLQVDQAWYWEWAARALRRSGHTARASWLMLRLALHSRNPAHFVRALVYSLGDRATRRISRRVRSSCHDVSAAPAWVEPLRDQWRSAQDRSEAL
jgi:glycosyltransferase involved in cell wall biosynthesis